VVESLANEEDVHGSVGSVMATQRKNSCEREGERGRESCRSLNREEVEGEERDAGAFWWGSPHGVSIRGAFLLVHQQLPFEEALPFYSEMALMQLYFEASHLTCVFH